MNEGVPSSQPAEARLRDVSRGRGMRRRSTVSRGVLVVSIVLASVIGFAVGTRSQEIMSRIGPLVGVRVSAGSLDLASVQDVYRKLSAHYDGSLDQDALVDGASRGMVAAAGDDYTMYMDAEQTKEFNDGLSGSVSGIGAEIGVRDESPTILRVIASSPAERAGVRAQDRVVRVNDTITARLDAARTAELIRGEAGTTVRLELLRGKETVQLTITRAEVSDPSVDSRTEGDIGVITVRRFDRDTATLARHAAEQFKEQSVKGVIVDVRDNGGGYLEQAPLMAGLWLDSKQTVVTERRGETTIDELKARGEPILAGVPTVVLVNNSSASASEILAGALQDYKVATVLGEQTYGKGSVQQVLQLDGGRQLKVTVARWYTPSGASISEKGITPDVVSKLSLDDFNRNNDTQLQAALKRLR